MLQLPSTCFAEPFAELFAKEAKCFAECFAIEAECFAKHSVNDSLNLHKDFVDGFADALLDVLMDVLELKLQIMTCSNTHQSERKERNVQSTIKANECAAKQNKRQDPVFKANEIIYQRKSKQNARQDPALKAN